MVTGTTSGQSWYTNWVNEHSTVSSCSPELEAPPRRPFDWPAERELTERLAVIEVAAQKVPGRRGYRAPACWADRPSRFWSCGSSVGCGALNGLARAWLRLPSRSWSSHCADFVALRFGHSWHRRPSPQKTSDFAAMTENFSRRCTSHTLRPMEPAPTRGDTRADVLPARNTQRRTLAPPPAGAATAGS
jgi:hypothetical protein